MISILNLCYNLDKFNDEMIKVYLHVKRSNPVVLKELEDLMKEQEVIINDVLNNISNIDIERKRTQDMFDVLNRIQLLI